MTPAEHSRQAYNEAKRNILHAISVLLTTQPFYGHLVLHIEPTPTNRVATIASDGITLYYNPLWVQQVPDQQLQLCILRIVTGLALTHHIRRQEREATNWQLASLLISLTQLYQHNCIDISDLFFDPSQWDTWVEQAYDRLPPPPVSDAGGGDTDQDGESATGPQRGPDELDDPAEEPLHSDHTSAQLDERTQVIDMADYGLILDAPLPENATTSQIEAERQRQQQQWGDATEQSLFLLKSQGHDPGMFESFIQAYRRSKIDWRETLRDLIDDNAYQETTWSYPNRRFISDGAYLPGKENAGCPPIYFAVDTSGSVSDHELALVWTEIRAAAAAVQPDHVRVLQCDAAIHSDQRYEPNNIPDQAMFKGRGGTAFTPVFELVNNQPERPACLIYLTDLYCDDYHVPPVGYPVIWVATPDSSADDPPWGTRVNID